MFGSGLPEWTVPVCQEGQQLDARCGSGPALLRVGACTRLRGMASAAPARVRSTAESFSRSLWVRTLLDHFFSLPAAFFLQPDSGRNRTSGIAGSKFVLGTVATRDCRNCES